ncbi:hypothetical protein KSY61_02230 [Bifidobacterium sp. MSK.13.7]|uniref:hypothetical protein n=1 Tax=Bifidobacterium TaxID=1678 RepID=UPI001C38E2EE|nr:MULTISPECIES: hypothetical protein [Bifidobacterium]MBV4125847.1 hypothetical protein [Bifidobacterium pseudocatenulatum]MBV4139994.1 hypothetical protein [Bifidobacterium sp. MSK.13.7]MBV4144476.1 hypothetical protein [Bifidobacterium sp. MSK.13.1]
MKASSEPIAAIAARVTPYRIDGVAGLLRQVPQVERRESPEQPGNRGLEIKI